MFFFQKLFRKAGWLLHLVINRNNKPQNQKRGLVILQIDGLSRNQFKHAVNAGRMPFCRNLLNREDYQTLSHYSGLSSSTPPGHGELFYGAHTAVPAFGFRDRDTGKCTSMFNYITSGKVERRIAENCRALLENGSSYGNIFTGKAKHCRFCLSREFRKNGFYDASVSGLLRVALIYLLLIPRYAVLIVIETFLSVMDFFRGMVLHENFLKELNFIPARVGICILLRELIKPRVILDIKNGVPIIHANFIGYDEQSHRRGPSSAFAHWTLKGIDSTAAAIWKEAKKSRKRDYDVWIYSDHGQEKSIAYRDSQGHDINTVIDNIAKNCGLEGKCNKHPLHGMQHLRTAMLREKEDTDNRLDEDIPENSSTCIQSAGLGPVMHIYFSEKPDDNVQSKFIKECLHTANIPMVMKATSDSQAKVWTKNSEYTLPEDSDKLFKDHPFKNELRFDMIRLAHHPEAGHIILSGWSPKSEGACSFSNENGAHAGPGPEETGAFALLPRGSECTNMNKPYIRPRDLRHGAMVVLGKSKPLKSPLKSDKRRQKGILRVMTYNIHSCIGNDSRMAPERFVRIISRYSPDIIALQETDCNIPRTGKTEQAKVIARELDMVYHYHPSYMLKNGSFGNAVLSRFPLNVVKTGKLPGIKDNEPRGVIWTEIYNGTEKFNFLATHLSFSPRERHLQIKSLMDKEWTGSIPNDENIILCGDFNTRPGTASHRAVTQRLIDTHTFNLVKNRQIYKRTWLGITCLDYIFTSPSLKTVNLIIPHTQLTDIASDHLPLIADIRPV